MFAAAGLSDIGDHFPETDPKWKGADSANLVGEAVIELADMGWMVVNCDETIVTEAPKLAVKAKTAEGMGLIGAGEGLAAFAIVLLEDLDA